MTISKTRKFYNHFLDICSYRIKSSYLFGWIFFADQAEHRLSLFTGGGPASTRLKGVFSNCWTVILNGNIELSVVMSIAIIIISATIRSKWLFSLGEQLFSDSSSIHPTDIEVDVYHIMWTLCSTIVPFLIGLFIQITFKQTKKYAAIIVERTVFSYILSNFVIMTGYSVVNWVYSDISFKVSKKLVQNLE